MSIDLSVYGNHKFKFRSAGEGVEQFEKMYQVKVIMWNFKTDKSFEKTNDISDVQFFVNGETLNSNFLEYNTIRILSNYQFCEEITLLPKVIKYHPSGFRTRFSEWEKLVMPEIMLESNEIGINAMADNRRNWCSFREFSHHVTRKCGGDKIIFIDDCHYQNEEDKFYRGDSFDDVFAAVRKVREPYELAMLELFSEEPNIKYSWYFDEII